MLYDDKINKEKELVDSIMGEEDPIRSNNLSSTDILPSLGHLRHNNATGPKLNIKLND